MDRPSDPELPKPEQVARFRIAVEQAGLADLRLGVAVSGGPDSLALLLLAHAAFPGLIDAATVDHALRPESGAEAAMVAGLCADYGIGHETIRVEVGKGNLQHEARRARYHALGEWQKRRGLAAVMTAHHADDQAETLLMRLNRGSGLSGLAGVRSMGDNPEYGGSEHGGRIFRPLLGWRKAELETVIAQCGIQPVRDPSNDNDRFERVRIRKELAQLDWLDIPAIGRSAALLAEADSALSQWVDREWRSCADCGEEEVRIAPDQELPPEVGRRLLARAIASLGGQPRGSQVADLLSALKQGGGGNVSGVLVTSQGGVWRLRREPPRR